MKKEYDFSKGKRGPVVKTKGKSRVTMYLDDEVLDAFRTRAEETGVGYQTLINETLRAQILLTEKPLDARTLRRIIREELKKTGT
jgi:uncharacterized protein (DUF4415 family)